MIEKLIEAVTVATVVLVTVFAFVWMVTDAIDVEAAIAIARLPVHASAAR